MGRTSAAYYRLWHTAAALLAYNVAMIWLFHAGAISHVGLLIIDFAVHVYIGFEATEWRRAHLEKQGYVIADITTGDSSLRAEQRFFDRYFAAHPGASA